MISRLPNSGNNSLQEPNTSTLSEDLNIKNGMWGLPSIVKATLNKLFEGSEYQSVDHIPFYKDQVVGEYPKRAEMTAPVMKGSIGVETEKYRYIAIKVEGDLTQDYIENYMGTGEPLKESVARTLLVINQRFSDGSISSERADWDGSHLWDGARGDKIDQPQFFTWAFTAPKDGSGPTKSQERNFENLKKLIVNGTAIDLRGVSWRVKE